MKAKLKKTIHAFPAGLVGDAKPYFCSHSHEECVLFHIPGECVNVLVGWDDIEVLE